MSDVIVIGGGASGMMASYWAAVAGHRVLLLERNEKLGKKIYITGKGRCNFTNSMPIEDFFGQIVSNPKFLYSALYTFTNQDAMHFFEQNGTPYMVERGARVFPASGHASDITAALRKAMNRQHVEVRLNSRVEDIVTDHIADCPVIRGVRLADGQNLRADAVILATGGKSYPSTGSTGDGLRFAEEMGHRLVSCRPALVGLTVSDPDIGSMEGLSLKNICLTFRNAAGRQVYSAFGDMVFTSRGISGPIVLSASSRLGRLLEEESVLHGEVDLKPAISEQQLDARMVREIDAKHNRIYHNLFAGVLPASIIPVIQARSGLAASMKICDITRDMRHRIVTLMKHFSFTVDGTCGFQEAVITQGGVDVRDIDPATMESKLVQGLYFAGELIDVDALTGGFNLQIAWSTGYLAGNSIR